ncbi:hypothetical protein RvY_09216 [Ramazzottius varieornatus]|uniref:Uncharacterized protein n=1 Tax=Ramazzottius varieornatus TaxID=947166 RepID=A0A1D1VD62_RAMVA|nr:hypothetical protein RvY_09216 [Ramazzottius varieornatus]
MLFSRLAFLLPYRHWLKLTRADVRLKFHHFYSCRVHIIEQHEKFSASSNFITPKTFGLTKGPSYMVCCKFDQDLLRKLLNTRSLVVLLKCRKRRPQEPR